MSIETCRECGAPAVWAATRIDSSKSYGFCQAHWGAFLRLQLSNHRFHEWLLAQPRDENGALMVQGDAAAAFFESDVLPLLEEV